MTVFNLFPRYPQWQYLIVEILLQAIVRVILYSFGKSASKGSLWSSNGKFVLQHVLSISYLYYTSYHKYAVQNTCS